MSNCKKYLDVNAQFNLEQADRGINDNNSINHTQARPYTKTKAVYTFCCNL